MSVKTTTSNKKNTTSSVSTWGAEFAGEPGWWDVDIGEVLAALQQPAQLFTPTLNSERSIRQ
jgi:hypothetical protein